MKKYIFIILSFTSLVASAQITPYFPPRTPASGQPARVIQDNDLRARFSFWMPYTNSTTPTIRTIDSVASNVQLLSNLRLAISKGLGTGFSLYPNLDELNTGYIKNQTTIQSSSNFYISSDGVIGDQLAVGSTAPIASIKAYINTGADATKGLVVRANSATQSASLLEAQTSAGIPVSSLDVTGLWYGAGMRALASISQAYINTASTGTLIQRNIADASAALVVNSNQGTGNIVEFRQGNVNKAYITLDGKVFAPTAPTLGGDLTNKTYVDAADALKANLASPSLSGTPLTPTPASNVNTTQIVNGVWVNNYFVPLTRVLTAGYGINTLGDLSADRTVSVDTTSGTGLVSKSRLNSALALKANSVSPTFTTPSTNQLTFSGTASPTYSAGKLVYDTDNESLTFYNNDANVSMQIGQESWVRVVNNTGSTIANGAAVYVNGSSGGLPTVALAQSNAGATTVGLGLATESIANGAIGYITSLGLVRGLNTSGFTVGAVYIDPTTPGALTQTVPTGGNFRYRVGFVTSVNATTGTIHVTPSLAVRDNIVVSSVLDFPNTATSANSTLTVTVTGAGLGDSVALGVPNDAVVSTNHNYQAWVSAVNTVSVRFNNNSPTGAANPNSATFVLRVVK